MIKELVLLISMLFPFKTGEDLWMVFSRVEFESIYNEKESTYLLYPKFTEELKQMEGSIVELEGYYIPMSMDENVIVLSQNSYAACFFCGNAGPESVAEVEPTNKFKSFVMDEKLRVKGKLKLNRDDIFRLNFIIEDAEILD